MSKKIEISKRKAGFVLLKDFCVFSTGDEKRKDDYLEVTMWGNGEGYDISIYDVKGENNFSLTYGQFNAIKKIIKKLEK